MSHNRTENEIRFVFVYGSLRPDDDSSMPWTKEATNGMLHLKAIVYDYCMYFDRYAAVKSNRPGKKVIGYLLSVDPTKNLCWEEKLKIFDEIEGTSRGLYQRVITSATVLETGEEVACFIYVKNDASEEYEVPEGDWLKRDRNFTNNQNDQ